VKLLAFNWRDPEHPEAGGAELHLLEILSRAVRDGDQVTWLAEAFPGSKPETLVQGIRILRRGSWYNAHLALAQLYRQKLLGERFDLVLEDINKVPFFTPCYVRAPVLALRRGGCTALWHLLHGERRRALRRVKAVLATIAIRKPRRTTTRRHARLRPLHILHR
jgi:hypothetical protein